MTTQIKQVTNAVEVKNPLTPALVADWIEFCDVAPVTQTNYDKAIQSFLRYLQSKNITAPVRADVISFRDSLLADGYKVSSVRLYLTITKKFFRWLSSKMIYPNVADGVKLPAMQTTEHSRDALTLEEVKTLLASFNGKKSEKELRNKAIMALMINCGLRSVEIIRLDVGDLEKRRGQWFIKVHGKARAGKTDSVQISTAVKKIIDEYLKVRSVVKKNAPLFTALSNRNLGQRLQTQTISRLAKKVFANIGIESARVTCHSCRHTAATLMLQAGVGIRQVQRVLRHRSASTTEIYSHDLDAFNNQGVQILSDLIFGN